MIRNRVCSKKNCATDLIRNCTFGSGKEIQISKHSDELAKIIGHSDEAKQLKLAIANGANDNITRPMVDKINDIVDSADKIEFKPKATLMDDVAEGTVTSAKGLIGHEFEDYLTEKIGGEGPFKVQGREFDGGIGKRLWEAKSGNYWNMVQNC